MLQPEEVTKEHAIPPFFRLAFRPFFLLPALLSVISLAGWMLMLNGALVWKGSLAVSNWHGHEMIFGFAASVAIGFLLTAAQTWTGVRSIYSWKLALLVLFWLVARIAFISNDSVMLITGVIAELAWWLISIGYLGYMIIRSDNRRNLIFIPVLTLLAVLDATMLYAAMTNNIAFATHLSYLAVFMMTVVITILGGRVIPFFTSKALNLPIAVANRPFEQFLAIAMALSIVSFTLSYWFTLRPVLSILFILTGIIQLIRINNWHTLSTFKTPLLWSLHFAYLNMGIGYVSLGVSYYVDAVSFSSALHIITLGTIGTMILSMMSRVSLGHTARPLKSNLWVNVSFSALISAALMRFVLPLFNLPMLGYSLAVIGWVIGFGIIIIYYAPILMRARTDGGAG